MLDLDFKIEGVEVARHAAVPLVLFKLRITNKTSDRAISNVALQCQIQIEAPRRRYDVQEKARLAELFGEPQRWGETLHSLLWTQVNVMVPAFDRSVDVDLPVACSFDFNVALTKYFAALDAGDVPLVFQFSGSVFYRSEEGALQVGRIPWDREAKCALPVAVWQALMERYYPNEVWLSLPREVFLRLNNYRLSHGFVSWEAGLESLLEHTERETA